MNDDNPGDGFAFVTAFLRAVRRQQAGTITQITASASYVALTLAPTTAGDEWQSTAVACVGREARASSRGSVEALVRGMREARRDGRAPCRVSRAAAFRHGPAAAVALRERKGGAACCVVVEAGGRVVVWACAARWRLAGAFRLFDGARGRAVSGAAYDGRGLVWRETCDGGDRGVFARALGARDGRLAVGLGARLADGGGGGGALAAGARGCWLSAATEAGVRVAYYPARGGGASLRCDVATAAPGRCAAAPRGRGFALLAPTGAAAFDVVHVTREGARLAATVAGAVDAAAAAAAAGLAAGDGPWAADGVADVDGGLAAVFSRGRGGPRVLACFGPALERRAVAALPGCDGPRASLWAQFGRVAVADLGACVVRTAAAAADDAAEPAVPAAPRPRPELAASTRRRRPKPAPRHSDALDAARRLAEAPRLASPYSVPRAAALARSLGLDPARGFEGGEGFSSMLFLCRDRRSDACFGCFELLCHLHLALRPERLAAFVSGVAAAFRHRRHADSSTDSLLSSSGASTVSSDGGGSLSDGDGRLLLWARPPWPPPGGRELPGVAAAAAAPLPRRRQRRVDALFDRRAAACVTPDPACLSPAQRDAVAGLRAAAGEVRRHRRRKQQQQPDQGSDGDEARPPEDSTALRPPGGGA